MNTVRLQKNSQPSLRLDPLTLPQEYQQTTVTVAHPDWSQLLDLITVPELKQRLESAVVTVEPNKELIRQDLQAAPSPRSVALQRRAHSVRLAGWSHFSRGPFRLQKLEQRPLQFAGSA